MIMQQESLHRTVDVKSRKSRPMPSKGPCLKILGTEEPSCTLHFATRVMGCSLLYLESVVGEVCNGDCLHESSDVCQNKHNGD